MSEVSYTYGDPLLPEVEEAIAKAKEEGKQLRIGDVITMQLEALDEQDRQRNMSRRVAERVYAHYEPNEYEWFECVGWACTNADDVEDSLLFRSAAGLMDAYSQLPGSMTHDFDNGDEEEIFQHVLSVFEAAGGIVAFEHYKHYQTVIESAGISDDDWQEDYCDSLPVSNDECGGTLSIARVITKTREKREQHAKAEAEKKQRREAWEKKKEQLAAEAQAPREKPVRMYKGKPLHNRNA